MYSTASFTVVIFSASSSGTSMPNASSNAITNSTWSSESAPRSSTNDAVGVTSASSTPSCSTIICLTRSSTLAIPVPPRSFITLTFNLCLLAPGLVACTTRAEYSRAKIVGLGPSEQPAHSIYPAPEGQLLESTSQNLSFRNRLVVTPLPVNPTVKRKAENESLQARNNDNIGFGKTLHPFRKQPAKNTPCAP